MPRVYTDKRLLEIGKTVVEMIDKIANSPGMGATEKSVERITDDGIASMVVLVMDAAVWEGTVKPVLEAQLHYR